MSGPRRHNGAVARTGGARDDAAALRIIARRARKSRSGQVAVLFAVTTAMVAVLALIPQMTATIGRAMVDQRVAQLGSFGRTVEITAAGTNGRVPAAQLASSVGDQWNGLAGPVVDQYRVRVRQLPESTNRRVSLVARSNGCQHVSFVSGRCPTGRNEVAISRDSARAADLQPGSAFKATQPARARIQVNRNLTVVGIFDVPVRDPYWRGIDIGQVSHQLRSGERLEFHTWLTSARTFDGKTPARWTRDSSPLPSTEESPPSVAWADIETSASRPLTPKTFSYDRLDQARAALQTTRIEMRKHPSLDLQLTEQVSTVDSLVKRDLDQVKVIVPLLFLQLVVLLATLFWVLSWALLTRRHREMAILRLRRPGRMGAARLINFELSPALVGAAPAGLAGSYAIDQLARATWLRGTNSGGWNWWSLVLALATALSCWAVLYLLTRQVLRRPVSSLLREVPARRRRWVLSAVEVALLTIAVGLLVTVATGTLTGAPVLATPVVLALAVGLVLGGLLAPIGNAVARRFLHSGRVVGLLAVTGLVRRPSSRHAILALTAAGAILAFATATLQLGQENRQNVAEAEAGAPVRLTAIDPAGAVEPRRFVAAITKLDDGAGTLAPVMRIASGNSDGPVTLAADPKLMRTISYQPDDERTWERLEGQSTEGPLPAVTSRWSPPGTDDTFSAPSLAMLDTDYEVAATVPYLPGAGKNTFLTPLEPLLQDASAGAGAPEVWARGADAELLARAQALMRKLGYADVDIERVSSHQRALDHSASAYGLQFGLIVAAGSAVVAIMVMAAIFTTQANERRRTLLASTYAHIPLTQLRSANRWEAIVLSAPLLMGGLIGWIGARLAAPSIPWLSEPSPYPVLSHTPPIGWSVVAVASGFLLTLLAAAALMRQSSGDQHG